MRKIFISSMILLLVMTSFVACGPNYSDELDKIKEDVESLTNEWIDFGAKIGEKAADITSIEDLNNMYDDLADEAEKYIDKASDLLDELDSIKDGISDQEYDSYHGAISALKKGMTEMQKQMRDSIVVE